MTMTLTIRKTNIMTLTRKMTITIPKWGVMNSNIFKIMRFVEIFRKSKTRDLARLKILPSQRSVCQGKLWP